MLRTSDLDYDLPAECIAVTPAEPRDSARLMVVRGGVTVEHRLIRDLPDVLRAGDLLVLNTSRVLPARFVGRRQETGAGVQGLYLGPGPRSGTWVALLKMRRFKPGAAVELALRAPGPPVVLRLVSKDPDEPGAWIVDALEDGEPIAPERTPEVLERVGLTPLPPYIRAARKRSHLDVGEEADRAWYQTVFAAEGGSVAAPTAGLHFTGALLERLAAAGIGRAGAVLHVGTGTFKAVETEHVEEHPMHEEWCALPAESRRAIARTRAAGGRVVAVGTTSARTLESFAAAEVEGPAPPALRTRLLITPGHTWRWTDALLTNFHLPRSTLMALVAAMLPGGVGRLKDLYNEAMSRGYRFYSYGDAMLILP